MAETDLIQEFSMYITKAVKDGKVMKWAAVNSDTDKDLYEERMSVGLYADFIRRINQKESVPDIFKSAVTSNYWQGGMPYLSVSHYSDLNGQAVPGQPMEIFIDGNKLKAKGVLYNSPLGHATYRALQEDKNKSPDDKIRISIGFLDLAHRHGNKPLWERKSLTDVCVDCLNKVGDKVYEKGYLVHLALTRSPVNQRTEMVLEEKSEMAKKAKTRKEDAASIIGETLAEEIDMKAKASTLRSDVLVEMSEAEAPEKETEEVEEVVEEVPAAEEVEPATESEEAEVPAEEEAPAVEKSEPIAEKMDAASLPYGGAVSMGEAKKAKEAVEEMQEVMGLWSMFSNVAWNIIDRDDVGDKKKAFLSALDEFKSMLAAKAMVEFSRTVELKSEVAFAEENPHALKPALDALLSAVDNSLVLEGDLNSKLSFLNAPVQELGEAITDYVKTKSVEAKEPPALNENKDNLLDEIKNLIQPLSEAVTQVAGRVGMLEAKSNAAGVEVKSRIPQPRSAQIPPNLVQKSQADKPKPGSLRDIINKSTGYVE